MTAPVVPQTGYAGVSDYELRTGQKIPADMQDTVQTWLNDTSDLIRLYLGECEDEVSAKYPDVLTSLTVQRTQRIASTPQGVSSASVGGTSVTFGQNSGASQTWLAPFETDLLDRLMEASCGEPPADFVPGVGELGVGWGGPVPVGEDEDVLWVLTGRPK